MALLQSREVGKPLKAEDEIFYSSLLISLSANLIADINQDNVIDSKEIIILLSAIHDLLTSASDMLKDRNCYHHLNDIFANRHITFKEYDLSSLETMVNSRQLPTNKPG